MTLAYPWEEKERGEASTWYRLIERCLHFVLFLSEIGRSLNDHKNGILILTEDSIGDPPDG